MNMDIVQTKTCENCKEEMYYAENETECIYICFKCKTETTVTKNPPDIYPNIPVNDPDDTYYDIPYNYSFRE